MSQPRSAAQGAAPRATPAATPGAAPAAATTRESAGTGQAPLLIELRTEELPPKALQRLSDAFTQTLLAGLLRGGWDAEQIVGADRRYVMAISSLQPVDAAAARNTITQAVKTMFPGGRI